MDQLFLKQTSQLNRHPTYEINLDTSVSVCGKRGKLAVAQPAEATICGSTVASNFWLYIFHLNGPHWELCLFWNYEFHLICTCVIIFESKISLDWLARTSQYFLQNFTHVHGPAHTYACPGQRTRFCGPGDLGQCFLLPFVNVITAVQPFLSAWTTEMSGAWFFSGFLRQLQLCLVDLCLEGGAGYLLRFVLRLAAQRCI